MSRGYIHTTIHILIENTTPLQDKNPHSHHPSSIQNPLSIHTKMIHTITTLALLSLPSILTAAHAVPPPRALNLSPPFPTLNATKTITQTITHTLPFTLTLPHTPPAPDTQPGPRPTHTCARPGPCTADGTLVWPGSSTGAVRIATGSGVLSSLSAAYTDSSDLATVGAAVLTEVAVDKSMSAFDWPGATRAG